jgi:hypothetical protein
VECLQCTVGTSSLVGSRSCAICAEGYFRPRADSAVTKCSPCEDLRGIYCQPNSTIATLTLDEGYWRLSPLTTRTYKCANSENRTACGGGSFDDAQCLPGHVGPLCQSCVDTDQHFGDGAVCEDCPKAGDSVPIALAICALVLLAAILLKALHDGRCQRMDVVAGMLRRWVHHISAFGHAIGALSKAKLALTFMQVVAALDSTFAIGLPDAWFEWYASRGIKPKTVRATAFCFGALSLLPPAGLLRCVFLAISIGPIGSSRALVCWGKGWFGCS